MGDASARAQVSQFRELAPLLADRCRKSSTACESAIYESLYAPPGAKPGTIAKACAPGLGLAHLNSDPEKTAPVTRITIKCLLVIAEAERSSVA
jgi:hypothetical protein